MAVICDMRGGVAPSCTRISSSVPQGAAAEHYERLRRHGRARPEPRLRAAPEAICNAQPTRRSWRSVPGVSGRGVLGPPLSS